MYRSRGTYWSSSKLSKWLRVKVGLTNPFALSFDDWDTHEEDCKKKAPIVHWITDKGFDKLQNVLYFMPDLYYHVKYARLWTFFRNLYHFRKALWHYRSYDYSGMMEFMIVSSRDMANTQEKHSYHVGKDKAAKELRVFAHTLERVLKDSYTEDKTEWLSTGKGLMKGYFVNKPNTLPNNKAKSFYKLTTKQRENDLKQACKLMSRRLLSWWS